MLPGRQEGLAFVGWDDADIDGSSQVAPHLALDQRFVDATAECAQLSQPGTILIVLLLGRHLLLRLPGARILSRRSIGPLHDLLLHLGGLERVRLRTESQSVRQIDRAQPLLLLAPLSLLLHE